MITARNIYGFRTAICVPTAQIFTENELRPYTFLTAPTFQKSRFRVEADLEMGGSKGSLFNHADFPSLGSRPGTTHELLRDAKLTLDVITQVDADMQEEVIAAVRDIMSTYLTRVNPLLIYHQIEWCSDAGVTGEGEDASAGNYHTMQSYDIQIAILPEALAAYLSQT